MIKCKNCIHFRPTRYSIDFASSAGKCNKFSNKCSKNMEYADICRINPSKCGREGKYFEEEPRLHRKILIHNLLYIAPFVASCAVTVSFLFPLVNLFSR
jgi:hypothetical protein